MKHIHQAFPKTATDKYFQLTSPKNVFYNCIAWAADDTTNWWWPDQYSFWPKGIERKNTLEVFLNAFSTLGYKVSSSPCFDKSLEKVALYTKKNGEPTHAAKQINSTQWSSKLGDFEDVSHSLHAVEGSRYGEVAIILERKR